jgi:hypothetical protein
MLVKKSEIIGIDMADENLTVLSQDGTLEDVENNFCVRFHLKSNGYICIPCFYAAGFDLDDMPEAKEEQLRLTQEYIDKYSDDEHIELNAGVLYSMDVYH